VSELDSKTTPIGDHPAYGEGPGRREGYSWWNAPIVRFIITYIVVSNFTQKWLPYYLASGLGVFIGGLIVSRFRAQVFRRYGFGRWIGRLLLLSVSCSILVFVIEALVSVLFKR
jgi:ABC-type Co2+ transport system permease subunit